VVNDELYDAVIKAIEDLFSDMSVPKEITKENLNNLISEIQTMIESLEE